MKTKYAITLVLCMLMSALLSGQTLSFKEGYLQTDGQSSLPQLRIKDKDLRFLDVDYRFSEAHLHEVRTDSSTYFHINIDGFTHLQEVGAPAMPVHNDRIALPAGAHPTIEIIHVAYRDFPAVLVYPALSPATDAEWSEEPSFIMNKEVYEKDAFYPEQAVGLVSVSFTRGVPVALVQIRPVLYNPVKNTFRVYSQVEYRLHFVFPSASFEQVAQTNSNRFTNLLKKSVLNPDMIPEGIDVTNRSSFTEVGSNYIIITHEAFLAQAQQLAQWKRQLGYRVEVVSQAGWTAAEVQSAIESRYNAWIPKPDYFVIIGDHTGPYAVPGNEHQDPFYNYTFATDLDYACMDGPDDWHPDMAHGRISVSTMAEAQVVVDKIINYEKNPVNDPSFYNTTLNCAQYQDEENNGFADRRFCHTNEDIHQYLLNQQSYVNDRVYYSTTHADLTGLRYNNGYYSGGTLLPSELRNPSFNWDGDAMMITSEINDGKFLVFHRGHGFSGGVGWATPFYTTTSMNNLNNGNKLPVVFSIDCNSGEFQADNCFAEKLIRMENKGAVGVVAASYYSFSGFNDALGEGLVDAIWPDPGLAPTFGAGGSGNSYTLGAGNAIATMGDVVNQGLYAMEMNWGGAPMTNSYQYQVYHWFGDPAMKIWTADPYQEVISAQHNQTISCSGNAFEVSTSFPGALATLVFNEEIIGSAVVDNLGQASISYSINSGGSEVLLTLSKHNHKPYEASLVVDGSCGFPPEVETLGYSGSTDHSVELSGDILSDLGSGVTESGFVYSTTPNPEIGQTGVQVSQTAPTVTLGIFNQVLEGLNQSTTYYARAFAININGVGYGSILSFQTQATTLSIPYTQDFENNGAWPYGWETDNSAIWSLDTAWNGQLNPGGYHVYTRQLPTGTGTIYSPQFNGNNKSNLRLSFVNYWQADYPGSSQDGYLYGSRDGGITYPYLIDEWHHDNPPWEEGERVYDISVWADGFDGVKFKWVVSLNNDWYWEFDNFGIFEASLPGMWTGAVSKDWNEVGNWQDGLIPEALTDVLIPSNPAGGNYPELNTGDIALCNNLTIQMGAHLYVPAGNGLTVYGDLVNQEGINGLVLQSDGSEGTASLIHHTPGVEATVQQYLKQMEWHLIGMPVSEATAEVFYLPGQSDIYLNAFVESIGWWGPWIVDVNTSLVSGKGYECWVDNNVNQDETVSFSGLLNYGEMITGSNGFCSLEYTPGQGLNLISNPYPCGIAADIDSWVKRGLTNTVWVWDERAGNYLYWNSTNSNNSNGFGTLSGGNIPPMQGFFVYATNDAPELSFPESSKVHIKDSFYKSSKDIENTLRLDINGNGYQDGLFISFNPQATPAFDSLFDAPKLLGLEDAPQLYTFVQDRKCSINSQPFPQSSLSIPVYINCSVSTSFTLKASGLMQIGKYMAVTLEDLKNGQIIDLQQFAEYAFNFTTGEDENRFVLHFGNIDDVQKTEENLIGLYAHQNKVFINNTVDFPYNVNIYDLNGKPVYSSRIISSGLKSISLDVPPAIYFVAITGKEHQLIKKLIIE